MRFVGKNPLKYNLGFDYKLHPINSPRQRSALSQRPLQQRTLREELALSVDPARRRLVRAPRATS
ncbi:hypothetical protein F2Q70_00013201 [Brassica cretica]|uniref:Uncharacterized protein n=1 Tax=Brassica cretica TaxID=69181 RepID=A0A3N6RJM6_BRACR|nr:hypothetical protein F2Q70_00013201 [Brassica cretica]KAF3545058.1 hypothetical protein DY000_02009659 [Brassica cretica]